MDNNVIDNNIKELNAELKYYRKERFKELFKEGDILVLAISPLVGAAGGGVPLVAYNTPMETTILAMTGGATTCLAIGILHFYSKLKHSLYSTDIKLVKKEIQSFKTHNKVMQKKLK